MAMLKQHCWIMETPSHIFTSCLCVWSIVVENALPLWFICASNHIGKLPSLVGCTVTHMGQFSIWLIVLLLTCTSIQSGWLCSYFIMGLLTFALFPKVISWVHTWFPPPVKAPPTRALLCNKLGLDISTRTV